jgi:hypothetical protein
MKPQRIAIGGVTPKSLQDWLTNHSRVLAGNISLGTTMSNKEQGVNIKSWKASGTSPATANTDFTIQHGLGYKPVSILAQDTTNGGLLYRSPATVWTKTAVTLRCTTASAAYNVVIF